MRLGSDVGRCCQLFKLVSGFEFLLRRAPVTWIALLVSLTCARALARPLPQISGAECKARNLELTPSPWDHVVDEVVTNVRASCRESTLTLNVTDPMDSTSHKITVYQRVPNTTVAVPVVIVVPTIDGITALEPHVASKLCSAGMASIIALLHDNRQPTTVPAWEHEDQVNRAEILGLRILLSYAESNKKFAPNKIGMLGLSLGGIITSMMAGLEPTRLRAAVSAMGGGNLAFILSHSANVRIKELRERRMNAAGLLDEEQYEDALRQHIRYDPLYFTPDADRQRILMAISTVDTKVPSPSQREQFEAFGRPAYTLYTSDHIRSLVEFTFLYFDGATNFLRSRFAFPEASAIPADSLSVIDAWPQP